MAYIGTQAAVGFSKTTKDRFSGDNSTTGFTMSQASNTATDIQVFVDNIRQVVELSHSQKHHQLGQTMFMSFINIKHWELALYLQRI